MSFTCIEVLSSDDDVEIISGDCTNTNGPFTNDTRKVEKNALQKLSRNTNIELTINLENVSDEPRNAYKPETIKANAITPENKQLYNAPSKNNTFTKNGFGTHYHHGTDSLQLQNTKKVSTPTTQVARSPSPDVVIIDDDPPSDVVPPNPENKCINEIPLKSFFGPQHVAKLPINSGINSQNISPKVQPNTIDKKPGKVLPSRPSENCKANVLPPNQPSILSTPIPPKPVSINDVVYIIDGSDEEEEYVKTKESSSSGNKSNSNQLNSSGVSHTEKIVQAFREKIGSIMKNSKETPSPAKEKPAANVNTTSTEEKQSTRKKKKISYADLEVCSQENVDLSSNGRLTRRSSLKSKQSTSKSSRNEKNSPSALDIRNQPVNKYSIENMFSGLVDICNKIFTDDRLEAKLWNTFRQAADSVLRSEEFISALKIALSAAENSKIETIEEKLLVQREVKEVIRIMKRHPIVVDSKVRKLTRMLNLVRGRIKKLEEAEVTSDEDGEENSYVLLDRYRARAAKIYEKLCELQGEPSHAGRQIKQRFTFAGSSGYPKIEQALQKFYQKTKMFPDFFDVKSLVEMTVKKENIDIPPHRVHTIAQSLFIEFGNRLQRMRCFDEYSIMNEYLDDGKAKDPALTNPELQRTLAELSSAKKLKEAEQRIFEEFTCKEAEQKAKEPSKSGESDEASATDGEDTTENFKSDKLEGLHFSDTDEELINTEVKEKRGRSPSVEKDENPKKVAKTDNVTCNSLQVVLPRIDINNFISSPSKS